MSNRLVLGILVLLIEPLFGATKVLKYSEDGSPTTLDPVQSATTYSNTLVTSVYDTLFEYKYLKVPYQLKPNLAVDLPTVSKDGKTYTYKIKKGVFYSDDEAFPGGKGREVVAEDFVYSLKRHFDTKNRSQGSWLWRGKIVGLDDWKKKGSDYNQGVEGLKALDKYTIQVKLVKPFPQLNYTFAMGFSAVVPHEAVKKYGKEISIHPVGSGPFILKEFNPQKAVLVKNQKFRKEIFNIQNEGFDPTLHGNIGLEKLNGQVLPIVDRVEISFMKQRVSRWNSFNKGSEIQFSWVPNAQVDNVVATKDPVVLKKEYQDKFHSRISPEFGFVYSGFNMSKSEFGYHPDPKQNEKNRALRCAVRNAFSWDQRVRRFYFGIGKPFSGIIPPNVEGYSDLGAESIEHNVKKAKKLLKDAGWNKDNLPVFEYSGVSSVQTTQFYEQMRGFLRKIGYPRKKVKFKRFATFGDYNRAMKEKRLVFMAQGWGLDYPDAENLLQLFYGPNGSPGSNNMNFNDPEYNKLYEEISAMEHSPERTEKFKRMNKILSDECVVIAGFSRMRIFMWHKNTIMYPNRSPHGNIFKYVDVL